jgi:hypothetical protein
MMNIRPGFYFTIVAAFWACGASGAGHAPTIHYVVGNDSVPSDRMPSPEVAARTSIDRLNARNGTPNNIYIFDHLVPGAGAEPIFWWIFYKQVVNGQTSGPWQYGSGVQKVFVCDNTRYPDGSPRVSSGNPNAYINGCPTPQFDGLKNGGCQNCTGDPINAGYGNEALIQPDIRGSQRFPLEFTRH